MKKKSGKVRLIHAEQMSLYTLKNLNLNEQEIHILQWISANCLVFCKQQENQMLHRVLNYSFSKYVEWLSVSKKQTDSVTLLNWFTSASS